MVTETPNWRRSIQRDQRWGGCRACAHFRRDMTCAAFPDLIPIVIASGEVDHLVVRPHQVGTTVFTPKADVPEEAKTLAHRPVGS